MALVHERQLSTTTLIFVRHGHAQAVLDQIVAGHAGDTGLSPLGVRQAEALRDRWAEHRPDVDSVLTSILPRAIQTAEIVASGWGIAVEQDCDVCELHPGDADGLTWAEADARYGTDLETDIERVMAPGGESIRSFHERVDARISRLAEERAGRGTLVVSHGGVINATMLRLLGRAPLMHPLNTSITEWVHEGDTWRLARYNDAAHLEGLS